MQLSYGLIALFLIALTSVATAAPANKEPATPGDLTIGETTGVRAKSGSCSGSCFEYWNACSGTSGSSSGGGSQSCSVFSVSKKCKCYPGGSHYCSGTSGKYCTSSGCTCSTHTCYTASGCASGNTQAFCPMAGYDSGSIKGGTEFVFGAKVCSNAISYYAKAPGSTSWDSLGRTDSFTSSGTCISYRRRGFLGSTIQSGYCQYLNDNNEEKKLGDAEEEKMQELEGKYRKALTQTRRWQDKADALKEEIAKLSQ